MRNRDLVFSCLLVLNLTACGSSTEPAKDSMDTVIPTAEPTSAPTSSTMASASASSSTSAEAPESKGPFHFVDYKGPKVKATISTKQVWGVQPVGRKSEWDILKLMREDLTRVEGDEVLIKHFDGSEIFIPGALVFPAAPATGLKVGDVVLADVAASSAPARVMKLEGTGDEQTIVVKYMWAGSVSDADLDPVSVVKLDDRVSFGARVAWKQDDAWHLGDFAGGDATTAFVIEESGHASVVERAKLKPLKITPFYKKGDKVWAADFGTFKTGKITEVVEKGLSYKVQFDGATSSEAVEFRSVTSPLE